MRSLSLFIAACLVAAIYGSTAGTRFQLVFMENVVEAPQDGPLEVHVSNMGNSAATVTVSSPKTSCPSQTKTVPADSNVRFEVCWWMRLVKTDYWPSYKTVLVESDRNVMVYAYNKEKFSADGFYAIPTDELAYSYYLAAYDQANIATQFAISATRDTNVKITLPPKTTRPSDALPASLSYKGLVTNNGDSFTVSLSEFETYLGQSRGDLTGTHVISDQPIAVFSGNIRNLNDAGSRDHLAAQLQPTGDWGTEFALAPVPRSENFGDIVRVIARRQNTPISIRFEGGNSLSETISAPGGYYEFTMSGSCVITATNSNKEIQVIQMVKSQAGPKIPDVADPVMFLLVARNQWLSEYISPLLLYSGDNSPYVKNMAFIAIANGQQSGIRINGSSISPGWVTINGIAMAWTTVTAGTSRFTHTSNQIFNVMIFGASDRESYGFALGANLANSGPIFDVPMGGVTPPRSRPGCQEALMRRGDGIDNDCDNSIDEESCNGVDDDNDGLVDEDCETSSVEAFGNEYVIMFMENNVDDNPNAQSFLEIYMSAVDSQATITYDITTELGTNSRTINPGEVEIVTDLPASLRQVGSGVDTKAIVIKASGDIVVYGVNKQTFSTDGFLAFPVDVVGTEYYSTHYYPGTDLNEFAFTPAFDDGGVTTVTVTMPNNPQGSSAQFGGSTVNAGQSIDVTLSYGQTAQFQGTNNDQNLNGARIVSDKPIAAFSGNVRARVDPVTANSRDHLVHQLSPVTTWGTEFVTVPIPRTEDRGDIFLITASAPNTNVVINIKGQDGSTETTNVALANSGSYAQVNIGSRQYGLFVSNRPVQVYQYVKTTGNKNTDNADPAMMLIPPVAQWSRNYQFITPRTGQLDDAGAFKPFDNFVMIAIDRNNEAGLRLDGVPLNNPTWVDLQGSAYSATVVVIPSDTNRHTLTHNDPNVFFQALMYGRADRESYALPLGMRLVTQGCTPSTQSEGDGLDNDCDGTADEELCNGIDDDADGEIDEDCGSGISSGTEFFLTFMENTVDYPKDLDLEVYVAVVGDQKATVVMRSPLATWPSYSIMTDVQPGEVQAYAVASHFKNVGQGIFDNSLFIRTTVTGGRADSQVVVYGVNKEKFSNDAFLVYPENTLGTNYYTCSWHPSTLQTEFAIVATQDNTQVTITLPSNRADISVQANNQQYGSGASFSITLQRFQTYQAQSNGDLTGTRVQTSQRAAVFSGNVRTRIELSGSRDHLVQQMVPTASYGNRFYVVPFPGRTVGDVLKIIASAAATTVSVDGVNIGTIGTAGGSLQYQLASTNEVVVTASNNIMVVQFVKSQDGRNNPEEADPAMFVVPSQNNMITSATFITPVYSGGRVPGADYTNYLTVVVENGQQSNLRFNGNVISGVSWQQIGSSNYRAGTFTVESGQSHTLRITSGASFYGRLYGRADRESYAFPIGFSF